MIAWVYGSGFPKSLDVSKAIDKMDAAQEQGARRLRFTSWVRSTGITSRQIDEATGTNMGGHYITAASQPAIMTREHLEQCRHLLGDVPEWVEREADIRSVESRNFAEREILGVQKGAMAGWSMDGGTKFIDRNITAPATEAARQWAGWGTALKPALEPITVARKPLIGTVAANVLAHGTGALNVDGCRVGDNAGWSYPSGRGGSGWHGRESLSANLSEPMAATQGRWPANLIHDGSEEVVGLLNDAARFFYCAKASKRDRNEGNNHPTVKPTDLMRYLCRLVTPPGGTVFDPFMGSGSTGKAAAIEGFSFIGAEMQREYFDIAASRIGKKESIQQGLL
jgi:hypothetical protein